MQTTVRTPVELDPTTLIDGVVRCQCERDGKICNQKLGELTPNSAQFYCEKCRVEVVVKAPVMGIISDNGRRISTLQNPDELSLLAMLIDTDNQAAVTRGLYAEMLHRRLAAAA